MIFELRGNHPHPLKRRCNPKSFNWVINLKFQPLNIPGVDFLELFAAFIWDPTGLVGTLFGDPPRPGKDAPKDKVVALVKPK